MVKCPVHMLYDMFFPIFVHFLSQEKQNKTKPLKLGRNKEKRFIKLTTFWRLTVPLMGDPSAESQHGDAIMVGAYKRERRGPQRFRGQAPPFITTQSLEN